MRKHSRISDTSYEAWPGPHKNVHVWWELENGKAVGWNESPSRGCSFPVITLHNLKIWNGRGDFGYNGLDGHLYVCASSRKEAVELLKKAGHVRMTIGELDTYYSDGCWGIAMAGIKREKGVWFTPEGQDNVMDGYRPKRLV